MIRILAGQWRGRPLDTPEGAGVTRPTLGRVRQVLFDLLGQRLEGEVVLDLFAGSGAVGLEALSRGARRVVLVERDAAALRTLRANIARLGCAAACDVVARDALGAADRILAAGPYSTIFLDPPYDLPLAPLVPLLARLAGSSPEARLVLQADAATGLPPGLSAERTRRLGRTALHFLAPPVAGSG